MNLDVTNPFIYPLHEEWKYEKKRKATIKSKSHLLLYFLTDLFDT